MFNNVWYTHEIQIKIEWFYGSLNVIYVYYVFKKKKIWKILLNIVVLNIISFKLYTYHIKKQSKLIHIVVRDHACNFYAFSHVLTYAQDADCGLGCRHLQRVLGVSINVGY